MKKVIIILALMCLVVLTLAGQYNDMIGESYKMQEWPGRVSVYSNAEEYSFQYNIPEDFEFSIVTSRNKLVKTSDFKVSGVEGVMYLKIRKSNGGWTKGKEYPILFKKNQFIITQVPFDEIFGTRNEVTVSFTWEFTKGHNLIDHSPFAVKGVEFQAKLKKNGNVIPRGTPG
jgi:hypothetical protein